ncbi:MAG: 16S rRNA (guanine(966)-N(2))-methyltransferase RsmD [Ignavibacteria bacterium RBG_13_36_8]|nr:MAG: 16S rRNA (guanine(966)-N(2))-methyltransferase RsmD [Ignavibacteria bacterium RBG_13_36_8]
MRIIAGTYKGRLLKVPDSKFVRPTTDKLKGVIFNYLSNVIDFDGINVCDIYAGSGSLGLEALSRGADKIHFVEKNYSIYKILSQNIQTLNVEGNSKIFKMEAVRFSKISLHDRYDLIIADPPFFKDDIHLVVKNLIEREYLNKGGILIIERSIQTEKKDVDNFGIQPFKRIGDSLLYQYIKE